MKKKYKIQGMDCPSCAKMVELDLEDAGITASVNYAKKELSIINSRISIQKVKKIIEARGYKFAEV